MPFVEVLTVLQVAKDLKRSPRSVERFCKVGGWLHDIALKEKGKWVISKSGYPKCRQDHYQKRLFD